VADPNPGAAGRAEHQRFGEVMPESTEHDRSRFQEFAAVHVGTLIGGDLLQLHRIRDLDAPVASTGGAGTFDGIFLTGILAVLLAAL